MSEYKILGIRDLMRIAIDVQQKKDGLLISGSLALIFQGCIDPRSVHDIDFCQPCTQAGVYEIRSRLFTRSDSIKPDLFE